MSKSRTRTRKFLFQMLFARTFWEVNKDSLVESFFEWVFSSELDMEYADKLFDIIVEREQFLLTIIKRFASKFDISTMPKDVVFPIFIASSEMIFLDEEIPSSVSINEAIELAKIYGDKSSKKLVNAVLDNILAHIDEIKKEESINQNAGFSFFKEIA